MGMNIYTLKKDGAKHLGKRWAAGVWCWDCKIEAKNDFVGNFWFCSKCSQRTSDRTLSFNPAMRELGFDKTRPIKLIGLNGASGWIWCTDSETGLSTTIAGIKRKLKGVSKVRTEYGETWPIKKFWEMFNQIIKQEASFYEFS